MVRTRPPDTDGDLNEVAAALGERAQRARPLGALTTYRVGGRAALLVEANSEEDLLAVRRSVLGRQVAILVVGKGSNILVADAGFPGLAVRLGPGLGDAMIPGPGGPGDAMTPGPGGPGDAMTPGPGGPGERALRVRAGAALGLPVLARKTVDAGLSGLEWAVGVPGSVGGAVRMNAGGHGSDVAASLIRYRWLDLASEAGGDEGPERLRLGYRSSSLSPSEVVVWAEFAVRPGSREEGKAVIAEIVRWRRAHQPGGSNAGSVFANPPGDSAGRLVELAGLRGLRNGSARVSEKHANFIIADDAGSADDVRELMDIVRDEVARRTGVVLRSEVRLVGYGGGGTAREPGGATS